MQTHRTVKAVLMLALLALIVGGLLVQAQGPDEPDADPDMTAVELDEALAPEVLVGLEDESVLGAAPEAAMGNALSFQGRLTNAAGAPLDGSYSVRLALYDVATGGTALCADTKTVAVDKGLFTFVMNYCTATHLDGKQLYLGVKVGADAEMTPRQMIRPVPYARGLQPGAVINQTATTSRALTVQSAGSGSNGTALWVANTNTAGGIGVWSTVAGNDAAIVASNNGSGALFKGFGAGGGEDEFVIRNNGALETKADSFFFIPGAALVKNLSSDTTRWDIQSNGAARIWSGAVVETKYIYYPLTIPTILYGQPADIESITVYYVVQNPALGYITATYLSKHSDADSAVYIITDIDDRTSSIASSYTLYPLSENVLSSNTGLILRLDLLFENDSSFVQIGGVRVQIGHHDLY